MSVLQKPPFWLEPYRDWNAEDTLVLRNGILNVRKYLEGGDYLIPITPHLYFEHQCAFDFKHEYNAPKEWLGFLESLDQDEAFIRFLRQWLGYTLWQPYDLQKYLHITGPTRCGKGTIVRLMRDLNGGPTAECSMDLAHIVERFGLEDALGKRLLIIPEMTLPRKGAHQIVAKLKAITGGDSIAVDRKHIKAVTVRPQVKVVMVTNEFVALPDNSGALNARLLPLKLTKSFRSKEDLELAEKLAEEYPDILLWSLEGLRDLRESNGRFTLPESSLHELEELAEASAPVQGFVQECCGLDLGKAVQCDSLYLIYRQWSNATYPDQAPLSQDEFQRELKAAVPTTRKDRLGAPNAIECKGAALVATDYDCCDEGKRPQAWLGIAPKPDYTQRSSFSLSLGA